MNVTSTILMATGEMQVTFESGRTATVFLENAEPVRIKWRGATIWRKGQTPGGPASITGATLAAVAAYKPPAPELAKILHRHGGEITAITHIGHSTYKGVAEWHFIGDVTWSDGSQSKGLEIGPNMVCYDSDIPGSKSRVDALMAKLDAYLHANGEHHEPKHHRDGRVSFWTPTQKSHRAEVTE